MIEQRKKAERTNFTHRFISNLPPLAKGSSNYPLIYDEVVRSLAIRVNKNGTKTFLVSRRFGPKSEKITIGRFPDLSVAEARRKAEEINGLCAGGINPADNGRRRTDSPTLGEIFSHYLERHGKKKRSWKEMERNFHRWFADWSDLPAKCLTIENMERRHQDLNETRGPYAANRAVQLIRAVYNKALAYKLVDGENPACGITLWTERSRDRVLESYELQAFWNALDQSSNPDFQDFVVLSLFLGQRKRTMLSMRFQDIDQAGYWNIPGEQMKNGRPLSLALGETELLIIEKRRETVPGDFVFPGNGKSGHYEEPKRAWKTLLRNAGITGLRIHDLRRTLAAAMAGTGAELALISNVLNHKDIKTTMNVYARTSKSAELAARERAVASLSSNSL